MANPFVFLVGCPRSGTTLLARIMDAHPQIAIIGTVGKLIKWLEGRNGLTPEGFITPELPEKERIFRFMSSHELSGLGNQLLGSGQQVSLGISLSHILDRRAEELGKPFVGSKACSIGHKARSKVLQILTLHNLWPQAKFVHLIRDGRDVCLSAISWRKADSLAEGFTTWTEDSVTTAALWWEWQVRICRKDGNALMPKLYYEIRYEALVARPEAECKALCEFLGVPFDETMLQFHKHRERDDPNLDAKHAWRPITPGLRNWRNEMPQKDVERFEAVAGDLLDELGYPRGTQDLSSEAMKHAARFRDLFVADSFPQ